MQNDTIYKIYSEELKFPELKESDDFFEVGGHSLIMAIIQERMKREMDMDLTMDLLFRNSSVESLRKALVAAQSKQ